MKFGKSLTVWSVLFLLSAVAVQHAGCEQRETPIRPLTNKNIKSTDESLLEYKHVKVTDTADPWRDNDRPKLYVDYLKGPLKGKHCTTYSYRLHVRHGQGF